MELAITLAITVLGVLALREPIKRAPWVFYLVAAALNVVLLAGMAPSLPAALRDLLILVMQKGALGVSLFAVVMWIGVLSRDGWASRWLRPIRAELSIMACILITGHMLTYMRAYLSMISAGGALKAQMIAALCVSQVLLVLILVLGVTSARFVKRRMGARTWKKIQVWAYLFYGLVLAHMSLALGASAVGGGTAARVTLAVYGMVFGGYIIARVWRAMIDRRDKVDLVESVRDQGFVK